MTKYEQYYSDMLSKNQVLFDQFGHIHQQYVLEPDKYKPEFDEVGAEVAEIITEYENRLCSHSEKGKYGVYSNKLAEKFWDLIRVEFPKIDDVGIEVSYVALKDLPTKTVPSKPKPLKTITSQSADELADSTINDVLSDLKITRL